MIPRLELSKEGRGQFCRAVGLLFADSNQTTIYNRIQVVRELPNVTVGG